MTIRSIFWLAPRLCGDSFFRGLWAFRIHPGRGPGWLLLLITAFVSTAPGQTYADLHEFTATAGGCCPQYPAVMAQAEDGNVYGITPTGGASNYGVVFQITPSGSYNVIHSFDKVHGSTPIGGLTLGSDGNLYGTAEEGGANGFGNIFKITPSGVFTVLYDFTGNADGGYPVSALTLGVDGNFYGTSYPGAAFKITSKGVFKVLNKIPTTTYGPLLQATDGNFYGVTEFGGTYSAGTVYKIAGTKVTTLYSFDGPHGSYPIGGLVQASDGNLYGTTTAGGGSNAGVIYKITTTGNLTVVVSFDSVHNLPGYQSFAGLIAGSDGNLYGVTIWGGTSGYGTIFSLSTAGSYAVLYNFNAPLTDGAYATPMQHTNGEIFGMNKRGGALGKGGIYSLNDSLPQYALVPVPQGPVGKSVGILGTGFSGTSSVEFNGTPASFHVISDSYLTTKVPSGETGFIRVNTSSGTLTSNRLFKVTPKVTEISAASGNVGDPVVVTGTGLIQTIRITVGGIPVTAYIVNSDLQVTFRIPTGAKTGKIVFTTPGGSATSQQVFTVN